MEDVIESLEEQRNSVAVENLDCTDKDKKEYLQLAYMAIGDAVSYLEEHNEL